MATATVQYGTLRGLAATPILEIGQSPNSLARSATNVRQRNRNRKTVDESKPFRKTPVQQISMGYL
jgi:hypothetical protein